MGILKWDIESILIAAINNAIRTNYITEKIDNTHRNRKLRFCIDKDDTLTYKIKEGNKHKRNIRLRTTGMGKMIHWELYKTLKFDQVPNDICTNQTPSDKMRFILFWDFEVQKDHLILAPKQGLVAINTNKGTCRLVDFDVSVFNRVKKCESKNIWENFKKLYDKRVTVIPVIVGTLGMVAKTMEKRWGIGNLKKSRDHLGSALKINLSVLSWLAVM